MNGMTPMTVRVKSYSELIRFPTFEERYAYLRMKARMGGETFGFDRYLNQVFYRSRLWRDLRHRIIVRDNGCDLAVPGYEIHSMIVVHHINPLTFEDIEDQTDNLLDPEGLITTSHETHMAIHYARANPLPSPLIERRSGDQIPWR